MTERVAIRICNIGLTLTFTALTFVIFDMRNPAFHISAIAAGWFARSIISEWR